MSCELTISLGLPTNTDHFYVYLCDIRVRRKTITMEGRTTILMAVVFPYMINPDQANMRGKVGFVFGGLAVLLLLWSWLNLPELKRTGSDFQSQNQIS